MYNIVYPEFDRESEINEVMSMYYIYLRDFWIRVITELRKSKYWKGQVPIFVFVEPQNWSHELEKTCTFKNVVSPLSSHLIKSTAILWSASLYSSNTSRVPSSFKSKKDASWICPKETSAGWISLGLVRNSNLLK